MTIKTKFDIGGCLWVMVNNSPRKMKVTDIHLHKQNGCFYAEYDLLDSDGQNHFSLSAHPEALCFPTKAELLLSFLTEDELKEFISKSNIK